MREHNNTTDSGYVFDIYLGMPYSCIDEGIKELRFHISNIAAGMLIERGKRVYAPISMSHPICRDYPRLDTDFAPWRSQDLSALNASKEFYVLQLAGWEKSEGLREEIKFWRKHKDSDSIPLFIRDFPALRNSHLNGLVEIHDKNFRELSGNTKNRE